jgi:Predicted transcriptional regulators
MLTLQLKELEACGIVRRDVYPGKIVRIEYALTELGETAKPVIRAISSWGSSYKQAVSALREG